MSVRNTMAVHCKCQSQSLHKPEPAAPATWRGRLTRSLFIIGALTLHSHAQLDTSGTGMSDVWERHFNNGDLFEPQNPAHHPEADPDGDGWTNLQESIAGTDPFSGTPPQGMVATLITHLKDQEEAPSPEHPEGRIIDLAVISWDTLPGKQYTLLFSPGLSASSWLPASAPITGDGQVAALSVTLTDGNGLSPDKLFWRVAINDLDSDGDGLTDYEEYQLGLNPFAAETHLGISDFWIATHFPTTAGAFDPNAVPHGNGLTNQEMHDLGLDPNQAVTIGPVNLGLQEDITDSPDLSFRDIYPSDLYYQDSVDGWQPVIGEYIEIWDEDDGNPYLELQAHWGSHGVRQQFDMLPGSTVSFILRYKGRYEFESEQNEFTLKVEGAHEVLFDGADGEASGNIISRKFMEEDEYLKYASWHYTTVSITADTEATELVPITLSLMPVETITYDENEERPSTYGGFVGFIPIEIAPKVLAVNSNFDEGRIDTATGYAIPDCDDMPGVCPITGAGNTLMALEAVRDHLDDEYTQYERVTNNLHEGWFGVNPDTFDDGFWEGATVKIRKIDKIDDDTGYPESGQVRFYAKWGDGPSQYRGIPTYDPATLEAVNLVTGGINNAPEESVYGSNSIIPENAVFYMEGVRPGRITLEWSYQKGDVDLRYEQKFLVATEQSKEQWIDQINYQIKLQSTELQSVLADPQYGLTFAHALHAFPIDMTLYEPDAGLYSFQSKNYVYIQTIYYYYKQLFRQMPEKFYWTGMAKSAGAAVYAGMVDMNAWRSWIFADTNSIDQVLNGFMIQGNKDIFDDMAWAHHAYISSGIWALEYLQDQQVHDGSLDQSPYTSYLAWQEIDDGIRGESVELLHQGNRRILDREQNIVMQPLYDTMKNVWLKPNVDVALASWFAGVVVPPQNAESKINIDEMFTLNGLNPIHMADGPMLRDVVPSGLLSTFSDRWQWIENDSNGMLQIWLGTSNGVTGFEAHQRMNWNMAALWQHAYIYSMLPELGGVRQQAFPPAW